MNKISNQTREWAYFSQPNTFDVKKTTKELRTFIILQTVPIKKLLYTVVKLFPFSVPEVPAQLFSGVMELLWFKQSRKMITTIASLVQMTDTKRFLSFIVISSL